MWTLCSEMADGEESHSRKFPQSGCSVYTIRELASVGKVAFYIKSLDNTNDSCVEMLDKIANGTL